ncbi:MAG: methylenetetrahydrofolate reductase [NAD(P)H] [Zoogloeaceae bacterium]|jgi:methylenetetrahydrofolate reductase (NADPH)|nr:methylenetetrahydrofolate reductase [NAD(P)H] [Zoogloeaceae bacterium]
MNNFEFSVEFFPPQTAEGTEKLRATWTKLALLKPAFCSVTFGAGGSTQDRTFATIEEIRAAGLPAAPHLSCIGSTQTRIREILHRYKDSGIRRIVALRGDLPSGMAEPGEFRHANELVEFIRRETGDWFHIEVAAYPEYHPQAKSPRDDLANFKRKVDAGANGAITQFFYNADAYERFVDAARAAGIAIPIVPGIMPIVSFSKLARFADACGTEIPRWMRKQFESFGDDAAAIRAYGLDAVTRLCRQLIEAGAPGLHFYTLNQASLTSEIVERLKR